MLILMLVIGLMLPVGSSQAQPRITPEGGFGGNLPDIQQTREGASQNAQATVDAVQQNASSTRDAISGNAAATRTAIAGNADARATSIVSTAQARATDAVSTAQARSVDVQTTVQARATFAVSTAQARATTVTDDMQVRATDAAATVQILVDQGQQNLQATVTAVVAEWEDYVDALPDEAVALIDYYIENSSIDYDPETNTLAVDTFVSEATINEVVDPLVASAGYDPDSVTVDATAGQLYLILTQQGTEVTLIYELVVIDGTVEVVLVGSLLNGQPLPIEALPEEVTSISQLGLASSYADSINLPYDNYSVYVNSATVTDSGVLLNLTVNLSG